MRTLTADIGEDLHEMIVALAERENVTIDTFVDRTLRSGIRPVLTFAERKARGYDPAKIDKLFARVPNYPPIPGDELPEGYVSPYPRPAPQK